MALAQRDTKTGHVAEVLRKRISDGTYQTNTQLPAMGQLAEEFGVAIGTIRAALDILDQEGMTLSRQGKPRIVRGGDIHGVTKSEQLAEQLRTQIAEHHYPAGSAFPSELILAAEYGVSRATVKTALTLLESTGTLVTRPGRRRLVAGAEQPSEARYEIVVDAIVGEIEAGRFPLNEKLPSELKLSEMYDVSRVTIRRALSVLRDRGVVEAVARSGNYVRAQHDIESSKRTQS